MVPDEREVYLTSDGLGRAAIIRRSDGLFCIYLIWLWPDNFELPHFAKGGATGWASDTAIIAILYEETPQYEGRKPEPGVYGTIDDARRELRSLRGFSEASLVFSK